jgi:ribonucleoside-triphosphate reductase
VAVALQVPKVIKRDGAVVVWEPDRIRSAVTRAFRAEMHQPEPSPLAQDARLRIERVVSSVLSRLSGLDAVGIEQIQDEVENTLMDMGERNVARRYIVYRASHAAQRGLVQDYLAQRDWRVQENSNMGYSLQGLHNYVTSAISQDYWLGRIYPPKIAEAHLAGDIHIHDAGMLGPYCVGWDLEDFLRRGVVPIPGKIAAQPPRHFRSALGQLVNLLYTLQGEAAGAQAVSSLDTLLAPFIRRDGLDYAAVRQALQEFIFNLNVPTRVGFQAPFTNITLDVRCPAIYREAAVVIGGEMQEQTYGEFQKEMDVFNLALCDVFAAGDGAGRGFTFPIPTYNVTPDFPWTSEVGQAICSMTAKYGTPYFANFVNSDMSPDDVRSMCCRLRLDTREIRRRGGGLFGANPLTGSLGVVTINLPRLGFLSQNEEEFFQRLRALMDVTKESLVIKRDTVEEFTRQGLYPYAKEYLEGVHARSGRYWDNHFDTIGLVGTNEAALNLFGEDIASERGRAFAQRVLDSMRGVLADYQEEHGQLFNLEATPAESVSYRLASLDRKRYPGIIQAGDPEGESYYTNSTHLPVGHTEDLFEVLEHQEGLQATYTGGTVVHLFLGEQVHDAGAAAELISTVVGRYRVPYITLTPTFSICRTHGYLNGEQWECPHCGGPTEVWSRVVGYYRPVQSWNRGKRQEFRDRLEYVMPTAVTR